MSMLFFFLKISSIFVGFWQQANLKLHCVCKLGIYYFCLTQRQGLMQSGCAQKWRTVLHCLENSVSSEYMVIVCFVIYKSLCCVLCYLFAFISSCHLISETSRKIFLSICVKRSDCRNCILIGSDSEAELERVSALRHCSSHNTQTLLVPFFFLPWLNLCQRPPNIMTQSVIQSNNSLKWTVLVPGAECFYDKYCYI